MKELSEGVNTIVVVGSWNKAILSQEWVAKYLLDGSSSMKIEYPLTYSHSFRDGSMSIA